MRLGMYGCGSWMRGGRGDVPQTLRVLRCPPLKVLYAPQYCDRSELSQERRDIRTHDS